MKLDNVKALYVAVVLSIVVAILSFTVPNVNAAETVRLAMQSGLGHLPMYVIKELKLIEKYAPGVKAQWTVLSSGAAMRDAMLAKQVDIGAGGVTPFIQGWGKGIQWKILSAECELPLFLNVNHERLKSIKDITPQDRIALPSPHSIQDITLRMAAEKEIGNPNAFVNNLVSMSHGDGMSSLMTKHTEITGHFTTPPFQYTELKVQGIRTILNSYDVLGGPHTTTATWAMEEWVKENPSLYQAFIKAMNEAITFINSSPQKAAEVYRNNVKSKATLEEIQKLITMPGIRFNGIPNGLMKYAQFMARTGLIKREPSNWKDMVFDNLKSGNGS
ncbi:MAG: ABC transporter substrate-binding protein [Nitrospirota bacterium]